MLKVLRRKGVSKIILWILAVIIIFAFGVFGSVYRMDSNAEKKQKYAGKVFGQKIRYPDFINQLEQTIIVDQINFGNNFNKFKHQLDEDRVQRTWVRILLLQEANKRNIQISDDEVIKFIETYPPFQVSEKFNKMLYQDILRNFLGVSPKTFEECLRDKLKIDKVTQQETANISTTDDEVKDAFRKYNEKVQVSYFFFANENFKNQVTPDESAIKKYYEENKADFATAPMVNVEFVRFDFPVSANNAEKTKDTDSISEADKDLAWHKAYDARQELVTNPDFNAIAAKNNIKVEESGFFSLEQPNLKAGWSFELIQKIFEMKPNDISQPVETATGFQILRVKATKDAAMPSLEEIKTKVTDEWKTLEASKLAKAKADDVLTKLRQTAGKTPTFDLAKTAKDLGLELSQTPVFGRKENYLPKLGPAPDFMDKAFSLTKEAPLSEVAQTSKGFCILYLDNRTDADMTDFEKEKAKYTNAILMEKKTKAVNDFLTHLRLKSNLESYLPEDKKIFR